MAIAVREPKEQPVCSYHQWLRLGLHADGLLLPIHEREKPWNWSGKEDFLLQVVLEIQKDFMMPWWLSLVQENIAQEIIILKVKKFLVNSSVCKIYCPGPNMIPTNWTKSISPNHGRD